MADKDRIVYPDEVDSIKEAAAEDKTKGGDTNTVEEAPEEAIPSVTMRNMISVPPNCLDGKLMDAGGVCRDVFE